MRSTVRAMWRFPSVSIDDSGASWVEVAVSDTGEGVEPELQEHIFEPYFSTRSGGTGLGLAIARKVVEDHGGTIALESQSGQGTKVFFRLPVAINETRKEEGARRHDS